MRIEINLPHKVASEIRRQATYLNRSRKSYLEFIIIEKANFKKQTQVKRTKKKT